MNAHLVTHRIAFGVVFATMTCAAAARPAAVTFLPAANYEAASQNPRTLRAGQFNGDGRPDLICASSGSDSDGGEVATLFGAPNGNYSDADTFLAGAAPWGVAVGDLNGDGLDDVVITNGGHDVTAVHVLRGLANGTFQPLAVLNAGKFPVAAVIADLNGDTLNDIAVANNVLYGFSVFFNQGAGVFGAAQHMPGFAGMNSTDMVALDFDNDGDADLAVAHYNGVSVFRNNGSGVFTAAGSAGPALLAQSIDAADFNGDGWLDLAVGYIYDANVRICRGNGAGGFLATGTYPVYGFHQDLVAADINRDGRPDIAAVGQDGPKVSVLINIGGGAMSARQDFTTGAFPEGVQPTAVAVVDVDGDLWPDLVAACRNLGDVPTVAVLRQVPPPPCVGDLDGDGLIGFADLNILLGSFNSTGAGLPGDLDDDGDVDFADLNTLLGLYNTAC